MKSYLSEPFKFEKGFFDVCTTRSGESRKLALAANDPVAGDDERSVIPGHSLTNCPRRSGRARPGRQFTVGGQGAVRQAGSFLQNPFDKGWIA